MQAGAVRGTVSCAQSATDAYPAVAPIRLNRVDPDFGIVLINAADPARGMFTFLRAQGWEEHHGYDFVVPCATELRPGTRVVLTGMPGERLQPE